ncbi:DUF2986 domain-containing protein [Shewanella sp. NIFS-20-20]|uniref:DUF2986 domain-containing protein n=1 Tax=Shewanella sp. NIFS-20-20 TaxID=2853806 RepID=UPI001C4642D5|nr:DUF2986 domain-containing protein [Shewanella sp. NIFS-20-20]MBV7316598.1 DUF2986 domain-containing protein [Shewanella sp. NIFS-20-20]
MNKKQKIIKKMAKRAKARENQKEHPVQGGQKPKYISKAERAKMEADAATATNQGSEADSSTAQDE